jgi:hypothetical protein
MTDNDRRIMNLFRERTEIINAMKRAVQVALWKHKRLGNPIAVWRDGRVVWIPPEEIDVPDPGMLPPLSDEL